MAEQSKSQASKKKQDQKQDDTQDENKQDEGQAEQAEEFQEQTATPDETSAGENTETEVPEKFQELVGQIESLSALDLSELVKVLEDRFGVSASAPVAAAPAAAGAAEGGEEGGGEEQSEFTITLQDPGSDKINVIKVVREITGEGLAESKAMVEGVPKALKENASKDEAEDAKQKLEDAGATVELS
ncbi:50S ribosomal protein L7/L12 [Candidatus Saccharibacteria bacterium QS_5_54_17]|nr:MAG: 50S ribosomal protein L7/L12 [Candidatus Saccharibacteria bacterium QS_5_54_17]